MKTFSGDRRHRRSYIARHCTCGAEASYAVQVLARTIGRGQSKGGRKIKLGRTVILCAECSRNATAFIEDLGRSSLEVLDQVRRPGPDSRHSTVRPGGG
jgi:hypothetical protein